MVTATLRKRENPSLASASLADRHRFAQRAGCFTFDESHRDHRAIVLRQGALGPKDSARAVVHGEERAQAAAAAADRRVRAERDWQGGTLVKVIFRTSGSRHTRWRRRPTGSEPPPQSGQPYPVPRLRTILVDGA